MATIDVDQLRKEVEIDRKTLNDKEAVLRYLENIENKSALPPKASTSALLTGNVIQLDQLVAPTPNRRTLIMEVQDVISRFGDQEFSVAHIDSVFQKNGIKAKDEVIPRSRISAALGKLEEDEFIVCTYKVGGSVPNRYKLKDNKI